MLADWKRVSELLLKGLPDAEEEAAFRLPCAAMRRSRLAMILLRTT
jgi:hypothetical protein